MEPQSHGGLVADDVPDFNWVIVFKFQPFIFEIVDQRDGIRSYQAIFHTMNGRGEAGREAESAGREAQK